MKQYVIKYLIGGYGSHGRVIEDCGYGNTHDEFLENFWRRFEHLLDCVKPVVLGLYLREPDDTRISWQRREFQLTEAQKYGK